MFDLFKSRNRFKGDGFSVEIKRTVRECVEVTYTESERTFIFKGEFVGKKWEQINLGIPQNLSEQDQSRVVANLGDALQKLKNEFVIYKMGFAELIPQAERETAIAGLREMGFETEISPDGSQVKLNKIPGWQAPAGFDTKAAAIRMSWLVSSARPARRRPVVIAKSPAANVDFF